MTTPHCPRCRCALPPPERLMVFGVYRRMAGAARQCPQCRRWVLSTGKIALVQAATLRERVT